MTEPQKAAYEKDPAIRAQVNKAFALAWHEGDRVELAPRGYTRGGTPRGGLARGTVTAVDECAGAGHWHVHIAFDEPFSGVMTCTASPRELTRVE